MGAAEHLLRYSLITATNPDRLTKAFSLGPDGSLVTSPAGHLIAGHVRHVSAADLDDLARQLDAMPRNVAPTWGISERDAVPVVTLDELPTRPDAIARCKDSFKFHAGPGLFMLDHDAPRPGVAGHTWPELFGMFCEACPALADAPMLFRPSASAGIVRGDGHVLRRATRWRCYIPVTNAADVPQAGKWLLLRLWAAGFAWFTVSKAGAVLERSILDSSVWQAERLDFAAAPVLLDGLRRVVPAAVVMGNPRGLFDLAALKVDASIETPAAAARATARGGIDAEARRVRAEYVATEAPRVATARGISIDAAAASLNRASEHCELDGNFVVYLQDGRVVSINEMLTHPAQFHRVRMHDPLEPGYRDDPRIAVALLLDGDPCIVSHARGERKYRLSRNSATVGFGGVGLPPGASLTPLPPAMHRKVLQDKPSALTAEQAIDRLRDLKTPEAIRSAWVGLAVPLSAVERECVIRWVDLNIGAPGPQALKRELRKVDDQAKRQQKAQAFTDHVGERMPVAYFPEASTEAAATIEAAIVAAAQPGEFVSFAGVLAHVTTKPLPNTHLIDNPELAPPAVPQIEPLDRVAMLQRIERVVVLHEACKDGTPRPIGVPDRVIEILLKKKTHGAPTVNGLVTHPLVMRDGSTLATDGLHAESGLYLFGAALPDVRPYAQHEAAQAVVRLRETFLAGFEFASQLDTDVALAGLLTGVQRRLLDSAPGLAALASVQSSGKTTLLRRTHLMLAGRDMPVSTFPINNETEVAKGLLSALLRSPCMIVFDNVPDGFTFSSGSLAAAMTTSVYEQRVLGVSRDASVPTTVLFGLTGNNITLGNDEVTRWLVCRLAPATARPQERTFRHPDVVAHALAIRPQVLRDVVGIVAGYIASAHVGKVATRYPTWDRLVRQPLMWAGASDVAQVFAANAEQSEPVRAHRALLHALRILYGPREFRASDVAAAAVASHAGANATLRFALESLAVRAIDQARSVGHALRAAVGRAAEVDGHTLRLAKDYHSHDKIDMFRVEVAGAGNCGVL